ncbi:hypothetical protein BO82DRAFT_350434 [Aspergillus uvarum CBS 121591]|uniref:Uncharacterized protein n=1 Tax=Aspergillus uvarum CBS 121591 TaxID=1448315 RepID=A0A319CTR5_9EURO|nr:hypothetical protein BO82DRAFT_350434 [Aspergillus uvarum CBS 121591]PYH86137.1 hypothetical protein BO82DRAFT_350434 [Aspergillus uvarum CBS 121591]
MSHPTRPLGHDLRFPMPSPPKPHHCGSIPPLETSKPENPKTWIDFGVQDTVARVFPFLGRRE